MNSKDKNTKIYNSEEYKIILFSPSLTKIKENEDLAVKTAKEIETTFANYNRRAREKISFGIGVNNGEIIVENHSGNIKITALGNLIPSAKKISSQSNKEVLDSDTMHGRLSGDIKTEAMKGEKVWRIKEIIDRNKNKKFLSKYDKLK